MTAGELWTVVIATYGAILATALATLEWKRRRPHLKVVIDEVRFQPLREKATRTLTMVIMNPSEKPVIVQDVLISEGKKGKRLAMSREFCKTIDFPRELLPGHRCEVKFDGEYVTKTLGKSGRSRIVKLRAFCHDPLGQEYRSKPHEFDMDWQAEQEE